MRHVLPLLALSGCLLGTDPLGGAANRPELAGPPVLVEPAEAAEDGLVYARAGVEVVVDVATRGLIDPEATTVTLDGYPMRFVEARDELVWRYARVLDGTEGTAPKTVGGLLRDLRGTETLFASGVLLRTDFIPPTAACVIDPRDANGEDTVRLRVTPSEPLTGGRPEVTADPTSVALTWIEEDAGQLLFGVEGPASTDVSYRLTVTATDLAGNAQEGDSLCTETSRTGALLARGPVLEGTPVLTVVSGPRLDEDDGTPRVGLGALVQVELTVDGTLDLVASDVRLGDVRLTWDDARAAWTRRLDGSESDGRKALAGSLVDTAGNVLGLASPELAVVIDLTPPDVAGSILLRQPAFAPADDGSGTVRFSRVDPFTGDPVTGSLVVVATEDLGAAPVLMGVGPSSISGRIDAVTGRQVAWDFDTLPATDGLYTFDVVLEDRLGNVGLAQPLDVRLEVDTVGPAAAPDVNTPGRITYTRQPWGQDATGAGRGQAVTGAAGAVDPRTILVLRDDTGAFLASGQSEPDGSFAAIRSAAERARVTLSTLDAAGNPSPGAVVRDATWTATLSGKRVGSVNENPHALRGLGRGGLDRGDALVEEPVLTGLGGTSGVTTAGDGVRWTAHAAGVRPLRRRDAAFVFDAARGENVLFGGSQLNVGTGLGRDLADTWTLRGGAWTEVDVTGVRPSARDEASFAWDPAGQTVMVFGGVNISGAIAEQWRWDGAVWEKVTPPGGLPPYVGKAGLAPDPVRGQVVLYTRGGSSTALPNETWLWSGSAWSKAPTPGAGPLAHFDAQLAWDPSLGAVVLFGGVDRNLTRLGETWTWSGSAWVKRNVPGPSPRTSFALATDPVDGRVLLQGGVGASGTVLSDTWAWQDGAWTRLSEVAPEPRYGHALGVDPELGLPVVFGGAGDDGEARNDTWVWQEGAWRPMDPQDAPPPARSTHAMARDELTDEVVLFGGWDDGSVRFDDTWVWGVDGWEPRDPPDAPLARGSHRMVWDPYQEQVLLFGGRDADVRFGDTWLWNGATWDDVTPASPGPSPRTLMGLSSFPSTREVFLFGGFDGAALGDSWRWNGQRWTFSPDNNTPPTTRYLLAAAWDARGSRALLFGGFDVQRAGSESVLDETWGWDRGLWLPVSPAHRPPGRTGHVLAAEPVGGRVVVFGGSSNAPLDDAWIWDGTDWSELVRTEPWPAAREQAGLAWDDVRQRMVLFGGVDDAGLRLGDTWLLDLGLDRGPAQRFDVDWTAADATGGTLERVTVRWKVGGEGFVDGARVEGADVSVWWGDAWEPIGTTSAGVAQPAEVCWTVRASASVVAPAGCTVVTDPLLLRGVIAGGDRQRLHLLAAPRAPNGSGAKGVPWARVRTRDVVVEVGYRLAP